MPAIRDWSRSTPLTWERPAAARISWNSSGVRSSRGSGPSRATAGTSAGSRTTWTASRFWVPASVTSMAATGVPGGCPSGPPASPAANTIRRASAEPAPRPRPRRPNGAGAAGGSSRQRAHPARDRWMTTYSGSPWGSTSSRTRCLPSREKPRTSQPATALTGGSNVLRALIAATSIRATRRPSVRADSASASAVTSGSSGTALRVARGRRRMRAVPGAYRGVRVRPRVRGLPSPRMKEITMWFHAQYRQTSTTYTLNRPCSWAMPGSWACARAEPLSGPSCAP